MKPESVTFQTPGSTQRLSLVPRLKPGITSLANQHTGLDVCQAGWTESLSKGASTEGVYPPPQPVTEVFGHNLPATDSMSLRSGCLGECGCGGTCAGEKKVAPACGWHHEVDYNVPGMNNGCTSAPRPSQYPVRNFPPSHRPPLTEATRIVTDWVSPQERHAWGMNVFVESSLLSAGLGAQDLGGAYHTDEVLLSVNNVGGDTVTAPNLGPKCCVNKFEVKVGEKHVKELWQYLVRDRAGNLRDGGVLGGAEGQKPDPKITKKEPPPNSDERWVGQFVFIPVNITAEFSDEGECKCRCCKYEQWIQQDVYKDSELQRNGVNHEGKPVPATGSDHHVMDTQPAGRGFGPNGTSEFGGPNWETPSFSYAYGVSEYSNGGCSFRAYDEVGTGGKPGRYIEMKTNLIAKIWDTCRHETKAIKQESFGFSHSVPSEFTPKEK